MRNWFIAAIVILLCLLIGWQFNLFDPSFNNPLTTREKYGKKISYYDFSKIPDNLVLDKKIKLSKDLEIFLNNKFNNPRIKNYSRFEKEVWEEASKFGYRLDELRNTNFKEVIIAAVKIVASRLDYYSVDLDKSFIRKYGKYQSADFYFHLKLGDCDKYRDAVIAVFNMVKRLNRQLKNVYLSKEGLGGNLDTNHAWVSVLIPQKNYLILSHIDPTLYDASNFLEAGSFYVCLENDIFIAYFYRELAGCDNLLYSYQILAKAFLETKNREWQEKLLSDMSFIVLLISIYKPKIAPSKIFWIMGLYDANRFKKNLDSILYRAYKVYLRAGDNLEAEKYKQRLCKEFPNSYWTKEVIK